MIEYKGYTAVVDFDADLRLFNGHVVDLRDEIYFEGDSVEALEASMHRAIDHYLAVCEQRGEAPEKPFSGKLNLRLGTELHRAAALAAASERESLNNWLVKLVQAEVLGHQHETARALGAHVRQLREALRRQEESKSGTRPAKKRA